MTTATTMLDPRFNPFAGWDVRKLLETQSALRVDHPCMIWAPHEGAEQVWSYRAFVDRVARTAAGLHARGVRAGERVIIHMDNCPEQMFAWLGCAWMGAVAVTTNAKSSGPELTYFAELSETVAAITQPRFADLVARSMPQIRWLAVTSTDCGEDAGANRPTHDADFARIDADPATLPHRAPDPAAPFSIQFTSGTTSRPKAVLWTHANAMWGGRVSAAHMAMGPDDIHLVYLPMFHTNAQTYSVMPSLWVGATFVLQPRFSAQRFWPLSLKHKCTWTSMVPFMVQALLSHDVPAAHHYRFWGNGACDLPTDAMFNVRTLGWWGMTETITQGIVGSPFHPDRPMSMGRPAPEYRIDVRHEDGSPVGEGETGDLVIAGVRGLSLFAEYLQDPVATAGAFDDRGWFITGDRATRAEDGWLVFADRAKDMLKVGGENVAASEIERVIAALPGVREVAVVGKPHPMLDEAPVAFVRLWTPAADAPADFAETAIAACKAELASFKIPHAVRLVDDFPRSTLEKIAKAELRKTLKDGA